MGIEYSYNGSYNRSYNTGINDDILQLNYDTLSKLFNNNDTEILNKLTNLQIHNLANQKKY